MSDLQIYARSRSSHDSLWFDFGVSLPESEAEAWCANANVTDAQFSYRVSHGEVSDMKQAEDHKTADLQEGLKRPVGRPSLSGVRLSAADRQKARRERLREAGRGFLTVELPVEVLEGLDKFVQFRDETKNQVIERLLRSQLLRKR